MNKLLSLLLLSLAASCATRADFVVLNPAADPGRSFYLRNLVLENIFSYETMIPQVSGLIQSLGTKYGLKISLTQGPGDLPFDITIRNKSFVAGFETVQSIAVIKTIFDDRDLPLLNFYFAEDTKVPLDSFLSLYQLLDKTFEVFAPQVIQASVTSTLNSAQEIAPSPQ